MRTRSARLWVSSVCAAAALGPGLLNCRQGASEQSEVADHGEGGDDGSGGTAAGGRKAGAGGRAGGGGTSQGARGGSAGGPAPDAAVVTPAEGGSPGAGGSGGATPPSPDAAMPGGGWAGVSGIEDLSTVKASPGCGKAAPAGSSNDFAARMITIPMPIRGSGKRRYTLKLPAKYDSNKPYRLVFQAPGCTGSAPPLGDFTALAGAEGVVQAVLQYEPGVGIYPQCFDDKRTDSVEYAYFEAVLKEIESQLCIDEHRVFLGGHSSGSWLSNQLGCVYGSTLIRAIFAASGGLAVSPRDDVMGVRSAPPCKDFPTPGIWIHNEDDTTNQPIGTRSAIERALRVNRCTSTDFKGPRAPYSAPGSGMSCESFSTCPKEFPIVLCHPPTGGHPPPAFAPAAAWQFVTSFP